MAFLKRLGFYLMGLSIGLVFLVFFLKKKSQETGVEFCYFPNCRTLKDIRSKALSHSMEIQELLDNKKIDSLDVVYFLKEGDIDFSRSDTRSKPCRTYFIDGRINNKEAALRVRNCPEKAIVESLVFK